MIQKLEYHSQIIYGNPVATFVIDRDHRITHWNRACEALTGLPAHELIGTSCQWRAFYSSQRAVLADLIVDDAPETAILPLYEGMGRKSMLIDGAYEAEGFYPALGEKGKWLYFTAAPLRDASGHVIGAIETLQDITDSKAAEEKVQTLNRELAQSVAELQYSLRLLRRTQHQLVQSEKMAALGGLVAGVAHEINTPVGIGVTAASLLDEKTREYAGLLHTQSLKRSDLEAYFQVASESSKMILSNLMRASDLIQSFKQVAVDQSCEEPRTFNLRECLDNIIMTLWPKLRKSSHSVHVQCRDDLELQTYAGALGQVVSNLIMNSLLHGFEGIRDGMISIEVYEQPAEVEIRYSDNGVGIPQEYQERIFEPFFTTKRNRGGTGLGLHILYNLVTQTLGGRIECESQPGSGTTFQIRIPRVGPSGREAFFSVSAPIAEGE